MKLQTLTVIFSIIVIPITLILSAYIGSQIDTASLQQSYDTKLMDATHDAVVAFELNTENNNYSTNADSLRRDIQAALNTFTTSLASGLGIPGANSEYIMPYIPAILITMYDGYYIYSPSLYTYRISDELNETGYTHILKPYVYYSAEYRDRANNKNYIVVNYSLDNYISLYGEIDGTVIAKSGYLESNEFLNNIVNEESLSETIKYKDSISGERRGLIEESVTFVYKDGKKIYKIGNKWYTLTGLNLMEYENISDIDYSAQQYKTKATEFMNYLKNDNVGKKIASLVTPSNCQSIDSTDNTQILTKDPEDQSSLFNQHKRQIIRASIQDNLNNSMALYNKNSASMGTNATFAMPKMTEEDWEKILTNVNIVTFMQGLPVGNKKYNNYSIVTSTNNKQYISPNSIYFVDNDNDKYHTVYDIENANANNVTGYKSQDFRKIKYEYEEINGGIQESKKGYYYRRKEYACYNCIVSTHIQISDTDTYRYVMDGDNETLKQKYCTALARERFNLDKVTKIFM